MTAREIIRRQAQTIERLSIENADLVRQLNEANERLRDILQTLRQEKKK